MRPVGSAEELERRRTRAVELLEEGVSRKLLARILGVSPSSLSRWRRLAGAGELEAKPNHGPRRRLTDEECEELEELLLEGATAHGWHNNLWTAARVGEVISRHFGVKYHPAHVSRILRDRLDWTSQKPACQRRDPDDTAIETWAREIFPEVVREAEERGAYLVFVDETGFLLEPTVRRTYAPRGKTPVNQISDPHARLSVIGAITVSPRRKRLGLAYHILPDNANFRGPSVVRFVRALHMRLAAPMTVLWDQIPIHSCKAVEDYLIGAAEVTAEPFPPYAPKINPADGIWRYVKYGRLANYTPPSLAVLRGTVTAELDQLRWREELLASFVRFTRLPLML
jgi:transposase